MAKQSHHNLLPRSVQKVSARKTPPKKAAAIRTVIAAVVMVVETISAVESAVQVRGRNCLIKGRIVHHAVSKVVMRTVKHR